MGILRTDNAQHSPAPFIVGVARSGTTLLRMMLDAHSKLAIPHETDFLAVPEAFDRGGARAVVEALVRSPRWGDFNLPADEFARAVQNRNPANAGDLLRTFYQLYAQQRGKPLWGDKSPYYVSAMVDIQRLLPEAHFVHVIRDGRDVALSLGPLWFGPNDVTQMAEMWSQRLRAARRQVPKLRFYTEVRYEDLVREPAFTLKRLCEFLDLTWEPSMLDYYVHASQRLSTELVDLNREGRLIPRDQRLSIHRLLGQPPRLDRIERWRQEMSVADLRAFDSIAGEMLKAHGYELKASSAASRG